MRLVIYTLLASASTTASHGPAPRQWLARAVAPLRIDGLVAAVLTPFDSKGELNLAALPSQATYLNATGVHWLFVGGTTGESLSLTREERERLTESWIAATPKFGIIAHVGAESIKDSQALAAHAEGAGAHAIGAMPPTFFKPGNAAALAATIAAICSHASTLPCYYYHIPSMTGVNIPMLDFVKAIEPLAPNFAGIKYTGMYDPPGMMGAQRVAEYADGKYEVLSGREEQMVQALSIGIKGFVGSQFNVAGDLYNAIRSKFASEGLTKSSMREIVGLQSRGLALIQAWQGGASPEHYGFKYFATLAGMDVGDARLPKLPMDGDSAKGLRSAFAAFCGGDGKGLKMCARKREDRGQR